MMWRVPVMRSLLANLLFTDFNKIAMNYELKKKVLNSKRKLGGYIPTISVQAAGDKAM